MERNISVQGKKENECIYTAYKYIDEDFNSLSYRQYINLYLYSQENTKRAVRDEVFFCPKCNKMHHLFECILNAEGEFLHNIKDVDFDFIEKIRISRGQLDRSKCPSCGFQFNVDKFRFLDKTKTYQTKTLKYLHVFEPKDNKIVFSGFYTYYFPNTIAGKLIVKATRNRVVFNYKTGQTYFLEERDTKNKPSKIGFNPKIINATLYNPFNSNMSIFTENEIVIKEIAEELIKIHNGNKCQLTKKGDFSDTTFLMLTLYNNMPFFNFNFYQQAILKFSNCHNTNQRNRISYRLRTIKNKYKTDDIIVFSNYILKKINCQLKKSIKKELLENPLYVDCFKLLIQSGFNNCDVLKTFLRDGGVFISSFLSIYNEEEESEKKYLIDFIKRLIKEKGEVGASKCLINIQNYYNHNSQYLYIDEIGKMLRDTALMYIIYDKKNMIKKELFKGDLKKIHDIFSRDFNKIKNSNIILTYPEYLKEKFNKTINNIEFSLAKDTYELVEMGQEMGICVGSYGNNAAKGSLFIVKMVQNKKYIGCLEISKDVKKLMQAKACFNNLIQENKAEALKVYVEQTELDASRCYDYRHIEQNNIEFEEKNIYQGRHNYAGNDVSRYSILQVLKKVDDIEFKHDDKIVYNEPNQDLNEDCWDGDFDFI